MEIEQHLYDLNDSGDAIVAYTMSSASGASVQICNLGASILSLTMPNRTGGLDEIAAGGCVKSLGEDRERFGERLWESRVEVNRVVMSLTYECDGVGTMAEVIFDFDDDDTLEMTYQACLDSDAMFDLTHRLTLNMGGTVEAEIRSAGARDNIYSIDGARRNILSEVATLRCAESGHELEILSSHPALYFDGECVATIQHPAVVVEAEQRYIQKTVIRHA